MNRPGDSESSRLLADADPLSSISCFWPAFVSPAMVRK